MTQLEIINKNLGALKTVLDYPCGVTKEDVMKAAEDFEGWGRCRNLIDFNSMEYKMMEEGLKNIYGSSPIVSDMLHGAQSASLTSFYTPKDIAHCITHFALTAYEKMNGKYAESVLEPSAGTGRFLTNLMNEYPLKAVDACEKDVSTRKITNGVQNALSYYCGFAYHTSYSDYEHVVNRNYDLIISNMPFGNIKMFDPIMKSKGEVERMSLANIHNYYFMKSMHLLNDGGIMAFITTRGFLSSERNKVFREEMMKHGRIISIVRLPDNMFETVDVGSDLIVYQKTDLKSPFNGRFEEGWPEDAEVFGMQLNTEVKDKKNQYGKKFKYYKFCGGNMADDLQHKLNCHLQGVINYDNNNNPDKPSGPKPEKKMEAPKLTTRRTKKTVKATVSKKDCGIFSMLLGITNTALVLETALNIMKRYYDALDDATRPVFLEMYKSLMNVMEYNTKRRYPLNEWVKKFTINPELYKFAVTLERQDADGAWIEADIFHKDVTADNSGLLTAEESLAKSLNQFGKVNMDEMMEWTGKTCDELYTELKGVLFYNPINMQYEEADRFLTGNVVEKERLCRVALIVTDNDDVREKTEASIAALEKARPMDVAFEDIECQFGSRWIPAEYYGRFGDWATKAEWGNSTVTYYAVTDDFEVRLAGWRGKSREWTLSRYNDTERMFLYALRGTVPTFMTKNEEGKTVKDEDAIRRGLKIVEDIRKSWKEFVNLPESADIREDIQRIYNEKFNNEVRPHYDGSFQTFPGLHLENLGIDELYDSQKDCVWMIKRNGGGVAYHAVGTGKTCIMSISATEMKRIGVCKKPMIIGLKANIGQIADTYRKLYPDAKLLYPKASDFSKENRMKLFNQIKNNDWDCIIMTHEQFGFLPSALETEKRVIREELDGLYDVLHDDNIDSRKLQGLQKRKENLEARLMDIYKTIREGKDDVMDFAEMGIDHILVDESHSFKNLGFATRYSRVAGIGNVQGSQRAHKLLIAIRDIQYRTGRDLGATFLSGTIVSNSLTELYLIFHYLRPKALAEQNIHSFDAWAAVFCEKHTDFELNIVNQVISKERFSAYVNLPELSRFLAQITDYRTATMCGIEAPEMVQHFESAPPTPQQDDMLKKLLSFVKEGNWNALGIQREEPKNSDKAQMLIATNIARQTALDPRMLDNCQTYQDEEGCKVRRCAANIMRLYQETEAHKGTQFVFNDISTVASNKDEWNMQAELKHILVTEYGVPSSEVAFINEATTDSKRMELFDKMNRGEVRVLIGSTVKLGTGVNAQKRAVAIHHLDLPWRPSDMEQRNGRAIRKGNEVKLWGGNKVHVYIYATERTLDGYKFALLNAKSNFLKQLNQGSLGVRRIDESMVQDGESTLNYAEFLSLVSGNTDLLEKSKLDAKIMAMEKDRTQFYRERNAAVSKITECENEIKTSKFFISHAKIDLLKHTDITADTVITLNEEYGGKDIKDLTTAGRALYNLIDKFMQPNRTQIGMCGSMKIEAVRTQGTQYGNGTLKVFLVGDSGLSYAIHQEGCSEGVLLRKGHEAVARFGYDTVCDIPSKIEVHEKHIQEMEHEIEKNNLMAKRTWDGEMELHRLYDELEKVKDRIAGTKEAA